MFQTKRHRNLLIAVAGVSFSFLALAYRPADSFFAYPLTEDGYLSLSVARNLAIGNGISADGRELTNGVQPLWVFLSSLWFYLFNGERWSGVFAVITTSSFLLGISACLLGHIGSRVFQRRALALILIVLTVTNHQLLQQFYNGLETGLLVTGYLLVILFYSVYGLDSYLRAVIGGVLFGAIILVRIDSGFFIAILLTLHLFSGSFSVRRIAYVSVASIVTFIIAAPWFAYGVWLTGSPMPVSGQSLGLATLDFAAAIHNMFGAIARNAFPSYWSGLWRPLGLLCSAAMVIYLIWFGHLSQFWSNVRAGEQEAARFFMVTIAFFMSIAFLAVFYMVSHNAAYFWPRYLAPLSIFGILILALFIDAISKTSRGVAVALLILVSAPAIIAIFAWRGHAVGDTLYSRAVQYTNPALLGQVELASRFREGHESIGAIQTGTLGFFLDGVFNLDGKVSPSALKARRENRLVDYMTENDVRLFVDFFAFVKGDGGYLQPERFRANYELVHPGAEGKLYEMGVYRRKTAR
jgi:hypothetical protein